MAFRGNGIYAALLLNIVSIVGRSFQHFDRLLYKYISFSFFVAYTIFFTCIFLYYIVTSTFHVIMKVFYVYRVIMTDSD